MAAGMAKQAVQQSGADASKTPSLDNLGDLFDEAKIREQAASFGLGVRYLSSVPLTQNGLTGVKATFAFDDVRLLNLNNREGSATPTPQLRFELNRADAGGSTLRVRLPEGQPAAADAPPVAPPIAPRPDLPPEALAMVRTMFKGAKITVAVDVDGAIVTLTRRSATARASPSSASTSSSSSAIRQSSRPCRASNQARIS
jgi:hypothetical protein